MTHTFSQATYFRPYNRVFQRNWITMKVQCMTKPYNPPDCKVLSDTALSGYFRFITIRVL
jgi:hypothetical protein